MQDRMIRGGHWGFLAGTVSTAITVAAIYGENELLEEQVGAT
jgi:hypothetical protein